MKSFDDVEPGTKLRWSPDGNILAWPRTQKGVSNLWGLDIHQGKRRELTHFESDRIVSFDWQSSDGSLAFVKEMVTSDLVLLKPVAEHAGKGEK